MTHPSEKNLALLAGGDLNAYAKWRVGRHVHACADCELRLQSYRIAKETLCAEVGGMPADINWERLSQEMTGNIRVGLAAGECIGPPVGKAESVDRLGWRASAVLASMTVLLMTAWWLNIPGNMPGTHRYSARSNSQVTLQSTPGGIQLKENGAVLTLMHQRGGSSVVFGSSPGSLRARYVDSETGQVTINNVYSQ
jgi:hypothetical protein